MERNIDINEISDGKKYTSSDIVKIGCNECYGCSKCCREMDGLITLDPYDIHRMISGLNGENFDSLVNRHIELSVDRGIIIPTLMMDADTKACTFLNEEGRCKIHDYRSGICRLFPLGRAYENESFYYFLQKDECPHPSKTKVKIKNWLGTKELTKYEKFVCDWHYFLMDLMEYVKSASDEESNQINSAILQIFYRTSYDEEFYNDFYTRINKVKSLI
ncbi:MAG: YkgJ family cysteine cluster protein [Lachnospiraceae bacterium]|nr:YkgJ family cysteine cluster protein [Lachnospiraceae bacterium]